MVLWLVGLTVSSQPACLPRESLRERLTYTSSQNKVRVVRSSSPEWYEARVVPAIARILLTDRLDYDVTYEEGTAGEMYELLRNGSADIAPLLWPAKFESGGRERQLAFEAQCEKSSTNQCVRMAGALGYKARSGWYVPTSPAAVQQNALEWGGVNHLTTAAAQAALLPSWALPVTSTCHMTSVPDDSRTGGRGGVYNCTDGSWTLVNSTCCPRATYARDECAGRPACLALAVDEPSYDRGFNEFLVAELAKPLTTSAEGAAPPGIEIVYGNVEAAVTFAEDAERPLLTYSWEPRAEVMTTGRFVRVSMRNYYYCDAFAAGAGLLVSQGTTDAGLNVCDYPVEHVEKAAHWTMERRSDVTSLINKLSISSADITELLNLTSEAGGDVEAAACTWLNQNRETWEPWISPRTDWGVEHMIAFLAVAGISLVWVFLIEPNFLRCSDAAGNEAFRSTKGTTVWGYDFVGLALRLSRETRAVLAQTTLGRTGKLKETRTMAEATAGTTAGAGSTTAVFGLGKSSRSALSVTQMGTISHGLADGPLVPLPEDAAALPQISFGQTELVVRKGRTLARLAIVRLDRLANFSRTAVTVFTRDGSAVLGLDHAGLSNADTAEADPAVAGKHAIRVVFAPGQRLRHVMCHILDRKGFRGNTNFDAVLTPAHDELSTVVAPVAVTRVTLLDCGVFPNGVELEKGGALQAEQEELGASTSLVSKAVENVLLGTPSEGSPAAAEDAQGVTGSTAKAARRANLTSLLVPRAASAIIFSWLPIVHYLKEAFGWCWNIPGFPVPKPVTFCLCQLIVQCAHNFVGPYFKAVWIEHGLQEGRLEVTVMCAAVMVVIQLVTFRCNMIYSGRWDVQRKMQMLLVRKYLSLDELDLEGLADVEEQFRHAILRTASRLSSDCYNALHSALSSCFAILFALGYIVYTWANSDKALQQVYFYSIAVILPSGLLAVVGFFGLRAKRTWQLWKGQFDAQVTVQRKITFMLGNPALVRAASREDEMADEMYSSITGSLWSDFDLWMYTYATEWWMRGVMFAAIYALWATGSILTDPEGGAGLQVAQLLVLIDVVGSLSNSIISLEKQVTTIFTSGSMVVEVARLLNHETRAKRRLLASAVEPADAPPAAAAAAEDAAEAAAAPPAPLVAQVSAAVGAAMPPSLSALASTRRSSMMHALAEISAATAAENTAHGAGDISVGIGSAASSIATKSGAGALALMPNEQLAELATIFRTTEEGAGALHLSDLTFGHEGEPPIFDGLSLFQPKDGAVDGGGPSAELEQLRMVPAGGMVGLRVAPPARGKEGRIHEAEASLMLLKLFSGALEPEAGICKTLPTLRVQLVQGGTRDLMRGTLRSNLLYGAAISVQHRIDDRQLWQLCRRCGMSRGVIGAKYDPSWASARIEPKAWSSRFSLSDLGRIVLVRALLRRPDVLLLHRVGDLWEPHEQQRLVELIRAFLDETLDVGLQGFNHAPAPLITNAVSDSAAGAKFVAAARIQALFKGKKLRQRLKRPRRTVVWSTSEPLLRLALRPKEAVLTLESRSVVTLRAPADVWPPSEGSESPRGGSASSALPGAELLSPGTSAPANPTSHPPHSHPPHSHPPHSHPHSPPSAPPHASASALGDLMPILEAPPPPPVADAAKKVKVSEVVVEVGPVGKAGSGGGLQVAPKGAGTQGQGQESVE